MGLVDAYNLAAVVFLQLCDSRLQVLHLAA